MFKLTTTCGWASLPQHFPHLAGVDVNAVVEVAFKGITCKKVEPYSGEGLFPKDSCIDQDLQTAFRGIEQNNKKD